jgi:hypothetical protein
MKRSYLCVMILLSMNIYSFAGSGWEELFNGKDFSDWTILNGQAKFYVQDNIIVGESVLGQANSFLCTDKEYGDFILEFEMKIDQGLNSGIQIRSESRKDYKNGRVHGYQVECDASKRAWTGGIYDEARRGWLYQMDKNPEGQTAFKNGQWNKFRIEASGNRIRTFVNDVPCADLIDNMTAKGFIGLQVHSIKKSELEGKKVCWRNLKILTSNITKHLFDVNYSVPQINLIPNTLSEKEKKLGWKLLWDGKTTKGWRGVGIEDFPKTGWRIRDGELLALASGTAESAHGDIVTVNKFRNFELEVAFNFTKGANSGIKYFVNAELNKGSHSAVGCEFQILDDKNHPDAQKGVGGNRTLASLYDLIPAEHEQGKKLDRYGWNRARIVVKDNHVEHWLNDLKMLEYERRNQMWHALVRKSKFNGRPDFGDADEGHISLQNHGDEVRFRSIKIKELN